MNPPVVRFHHVTRLYEKGIGVMDLDLRVEEGRSYGLVGPNGAGKTTILRMVVGMLKPQQGAVQVFGHDPFQEPREVKGRIGYVAEDQTLPTSLRPVDLFRFYLSLHPDWDEDYEYELVDRLEWPVGTAVYVWSLDHFALALVALLVLLAVSGRALLRALRDVAPPAAA